MMKRLIIIFTLLFTLFFVLTGCDNGSAPDSSSSLVKVCFTVDGDSSSIQKTASINGFDFAYQYKAVPQWTSDENIYGKTDNWTNINYSDGMSLGYFTPGQWIFYIQILSGSTVVYEGHSNVITISRLSVDITISVARIIKETTPGLSISITAPTEVGNTLTVSWNGGSASANVSESGGITTFTYSKNNLADGTYTITLTHSNNQIAPYVVSSVSINSTDLTLIRGHLNNGEWNVTCETLQFHDLTVERYNWNDEEHPWAVAPDPKYCGSVDYINSSAVPGERVSFSPRPDPKSRVISVSVTCGNAEVDFIKQGSLYLFIMPEGDVTIRVKFFDVDSAEVDTMLFRSLVRAIYSQNSVKEFGKYDELSDNDAGSSAVTLGDVQIWYSNRNSKNKICWKANNAEGKVHLTDGSLAGLFQGHSNYETISMDDIITSEITDMSNMFQGCTGLQTLNLTGFDAHNVTDMSNMFQGCTGLQTLNLTSLDASSAADMSGMFDGCSNLTTLTLTEFTANTTDPVNMARLFKDCGKLTGALNLSGFNGSKASNMASMFEGCSGLTAIDLSGLSSDGRPSSMSCMFKDCTQLRSVDIRNINTSQVSSMASMFYKAGYDGITESGRNGDRVVVTSNTWYLSITGLNSSNFDTREVEDMSSMFYLCSAQTLDVSNFKPYKVTNFSNMFAGWSSDNWQKFKCTKFETLDVSNWKVGSGVTAGTIDLSGMFYICQMVQTIAFTPQENPANEVANTAWDFSKVTDMTIMFDRCEKLAKIVFPKHTDLNNVTSLLNVFNHITLMPVNPTDVQPYGNFKDILKRWDIKNNSYSPLQGGGIDFDADPHDAAGNGDSANRIISKDCPSALTSTILSVTSYGTDYGTGGPTVTLGGKNSYSNAYAYQRLKK